MFENAIYSEKGTGFLGQYFFVSKKHENRRNGGFFSNLEDSVKSSQAT